MRGRVLVIGAGIGGLTLAIALRRAGFSVTVFERTPGARDGGSGLVLWANATRVLERLGLGEAIHAIGLPLRGVNIRSAAGRKLLSLDAGASREPHLALHRGSLHAALVAALPADCIVSGARCVGVDERDGEVEARFADRPPARGDLLIGADGLRSAVRALLFDSAPPRYAGQTTWRGLARMSLTEGDALRIFVGKGFGAGVLPIAGGLVTYRLTVPAPEGERDDLRQLRAKLLDRFRGFPSPLPELIDATGNFIRTDLHDRPRLRTWTRGRVTLLGDAAHPTTPFLGQGACLAIEDAMVLARELSARPGHGEAFAAYERARLWRTARTVARSRAWGAVQRWPLPDAVREVVYRLARPALAASFGGHLAYDAGSLTAAR